MLPCTIFTASQGWIIFAIIWIISTTLSLSHWYITQRSDKKRFFINWPFGTDARSIPALLVYGYACISQISPVGMLTRILPGKISRFVLDLYILSWGAWAILALYQSPLETFFWTPLFLWRLIEYTSIIIYQRIFYAGFPQRMEPDPERFHLGYRALIIDAINYLQFALIFATIYRANALYFSQPLASTWDAIYFSIITMTTVGYGDIAPVGCMRGVAITQIMFGIFMIAIIIGVLLGQRVLYQRRQRIQNVSVEQWRHIRLFAMDFDGIHTTDALVYTNQNGIESVQSSRIDGMGLELLRTQTDIQLRVISREENPVVTARCDKLRIPCVQAVMTGEGKLQILQRIIQEMNISQEETLYMGDDINDLALLRYVALPITVPGGHPSVKAVCKYVTTALGGRGAIREICELLLQARGIDITV